ncbi:MAG: efflux RND transporter periplasmic adaptor subunit [Saprospiraceae bacterium]|nr:efflux RND transporter periplasmic adaptor subunit [Saprospiraceae bacterium]
MKIKHRISLFFFVFSLFSACNNKNEEDHSAHQAAANTYYTCSMDPQVKEDKPGKCPICHMELTPMKMDESAANEITLSDQQIQLGNITTQNIGETNSRVVEAFTGVLNANQEKIKSISARAMGRIEKLYVKTLGDYIKINQPVYLLYSEDIAIVKQDYVVAFKQLSIPGDFSKNAQTLLNAAQQKLQFYGLTEQQIESIKTTGDVSPYTTFYSPYSGYVSEVPATEGGYVMEGASIIKLTDLSKLWLEVQVNINYAQKIYLGQNAQVSFVDFPDKTINTSVSFINPELNADTRLLLIRMDIPNPNMQLKPGMQATAKLVQNNVKGLFIPVDAVIRDEKATYIWLEKSHGIFENRMVETGIEVNGMVEIKTKIDVTKKIVMTGAYAINSEYKFRKGNDPMAGMKM